jgi:hypothetical protein
MDVDDDDTPTAAGGLSELKIKGSAKADREREGGLPRKKSRWEMDIDGDHEVGSIFSSLRK